MASKKDVITVVLLGKVGSGKSIAGNTLMDKEDNNLKFSEALIFEKRIREDHESKWHIFETPGIWDTEKLENSKGLKDTCDDMLRLMKHINDSKLLGVSVFLLVFNIQDRFTHGDKLITQVYEMIFGESDFWKHCILVMTGGEYLEDNFDDWVAEQTGDFENIVQKCNRRLVLLSSKRKIDMYDKSRAKLVSEIKKRKQAVDDPYSLDMFMKQEEERKKEVLNVERQKIQETFYRQITQIERECSNHQIADKDKWETAKKYARLELEIKNADNGTGLLKECTDRLEHNLIIARRNSFCVIC